MRLQVNLVNMSFQGDNNDPVIKSMKVDDSVNWSFQEDGNEEYGS